MKKKSAVLLALLLLGAVLMSGCAANGAKRGDTVKINYTLKLDDGSVYSTTNGKAPLQVTLGKGTLIPGFEEALIGMQVGESKTIQVPPEKAYGPHRPELVEVVSKSKLPASVPPEVGQQLQAKGGDGKPLPVVITQVTGDNVTLDANSPLAGKTLTFNIELVAIGENQATGNSINPMSLGWVLLALVTLAFGLTFFYSRSQRRKLEQERLSLARRSEGLLDELGRLDDNFEGGKIGEEAYRKVRAQKTAQLVKLIQRL
jgi:peptidylprolyl isomerase